MRVCLRLHVYRYCYCDIVAVRQPIGNIKAAWSGTKLSGLMCEMLCCTTLRSRIQSMLSIQMSPYS